jgi:Protein of unknown function (DUF2891)
MGAPPSDPVLRAHADGFARAILAAVRREYPNDLRHPMNGPDDRPLPHEIHPSFYGCYDWHSAVEMHWALVRLLRTAPAAVPQAEVRALLDEHLAADRTAVEAAYFEKHPTFKRPYGWGWALMLIHETVTWDDPDARRWAAALEPLAAVLERRYLEWLPTATYPQRDGMHSNSAFGLARALPLARLRREALLAAITDAAERWFGNDRNYPAAWEPSGADFLSPALTEAELMAEVSEHFLDWFDAFLPSLPRALLEPALVSDATDSQIAHLHGLNLSRAYCWRRVGEALPENDPRIETIRGSVACHAENALAHVVGGDYVVEHWLAAYALLLLT